MSDADDLYRFCVFCGADCHVDEPEHAESCPSVTGVYPVRPEDFGPKCVHCGRGAFGGMVCMDCKQPLEIGDHYMHREIEPGDPQLPGPEGASINVIICVGCAAREALT